MKPLLPWMRQANRKMRMPIRLLLKNSGKFPILRIPKSRWKPVWKRQKSAEKSAFIAMLWTAWVKTQNPDMNKQSGSLPNSVIGKIPVKILSFVKMASMRSTEKMQKLRRTLASQQNNGKFSASMKRNSMKLKRRREKSIL